MCEATFCKSLKYSQILTRCERRNRKSWRYTWQSFIHSIFTPDIILEEKKWNVWHLKIIVFSNRILWTCRLFKILTRCGGVTRVSGPFYTFFTPDLEILRSAKFEYNWILVSHLFMKLLKNAILCEGGIVHVGTWLNTDWISKVYTKVHFPKNFWNIIWGRYQKQWNNIAHLRRRS